MTNAYIEYPLSKDGYIHNWIVAGPHAMPVKNLEQFQGQNYKLQIAQHYHADTSGITEEPAEYADFTLENGTELKWTYMSCLDDHFVDLSTFYHTCHYLRAWAYAEIESPTAQKVTFTLTTNGPADVWLDGVHAHRQEHFHHQKPHSVAFDAMLDAGRTHILIRFEAVAARECPYAMALQLTPKQAQAEDEALNVYLPTTIEPVERRALLEKVFDAAYLKQEVFTRNEVITVYWPDDLDTAASLTLRLQTPEERIYAESPKKAVPSQEAQLVWPYQIPEGAYHIRLMPQPREYYEGDMHIWRTMSLWATKNEYSAAPYATYTKRRLEALEDAARQGLGSTRYASVFTEIAKMEGGWWKKVNVALLLRAIEDINQRKDCSDFNLVALLGMLYRYGERETFPDALRQPLEDCILNFKYWHDEPGRDAMCYTTENHSILFHTCEILAGQLYPERTFANVGQTGQWHREKGERLVLKWLRQRALYGFLEWDSNCYFEEDVLGLTHLIDLAENQEIWEMATIVLDKLFFTMALNSYRGVFGSTHGRTYTQHIKGGYLESTSGISRLMWGQGMFNHHIRGTVSLACTENYQFPIIIYNIATQIPDELWNRERHVGKPEDWRASGALGTEVNKVTYKTPDYMLCSAQDYHPGEKGYQQHIWQATLGPDAVVFVTHPACASEEGSHRPGFWHGNYILPRVAQWHDVLIAVHNLPEDDWMGFTHAYFPVAAFDAYAIKDGWAFAQKGDGYLALTAAQGLELVTHGPTTQRELRSYGQHNIWLCHMGRAALDGSFEKFQEKILALDVALDDLAAHCTTLRGETLAFGWKGPLLRSGEEEPITGFKHYENPYCTADLPAKQMEIQFGGQMVRLKFELDEDEKE